MSRDCTEALARYASRWETMTPAELEHLHTWFTPDARFRDPFNDVRGPEAIRRILEHMYASCDQPRFVVHEQAACGDVGMIHWSCHFRLKRVQPQRERHINGMSRLVFATDGRACEHVDHWDAAEQVYQQLPLLGAVLRALRRRLSA